MFLSKIINKIKNKILTETYIKITYNDKVIVDTIITYKQYGIMFGVLAQMYIVAGVIEISKSSYMKGIIIILMAFLVFLPIANLNMKASEKR